MAAIATSKTGRDLCNAVSAYDEGCTVSFVSHKPYILKRSANALQQEYLLHVKRKTIEFNARLK